jgi:hypothetical protein
MAALTRTLARTLNRTLARTLTISLTISLTPTLTLTLALIPTLTRTQAAQLTSLVAGYATNGLPLLRLQSPLFYANAAQAPPRPPPTPPHPSPPPTPDPPPPTPDPRPTGPNFCNARACAPSLGPHLSTLPRLRPGASCAAHTPSGTPLPAPSS